MGAAPSLNHEIKHAKEVMEKFLLNFAKNYAMLYAVGMAKAALHEQDKAARGRKWELLKCNDEPEAPIRKQGVLLKRSLHLKNWNSRYIVVRGNWVIDYWENEQHFLDGKKPRGSLNATGMHIIRDPNDTLLNRVIELAKKCNVNVDDIPKPERLPDHCLEISHDTRECWLLQCANAEEHKGWCDIFEECRWFCPSLNIQDDKIHKAIFQQALWRTRWDTGLWGYWQGGGGEEQYITDCINDAVVDAVMPAVDGKLKLPWAVRNKIRNVFTKNVNVAASGAVKPAWAVAYTGVKKIRDAAKEKVGKSVGPIGEAQRALQEKIMDAADKPSKKVINDKVQLHLDPLLQIIFAPVNDAFKLILLAYDTALERGRAHYAPREDRLYLVRHQSYNNFYWDADRKLWADLYDPLWEMRKVFSDVSPWGITGKARRRLRKVFKNALFTFETRLEEQGGAEHWDRVAAETRETMKHDCRAAVSRVLGKLLFGVVEQFWLTAVIKPLRKETRKLGEHIPEPVKLFLDPEELLERTLHNVLLQCCINVVAPYSDRVEM
jgi:hypothetical protein